jgi:hypothetical protein
MARVRSTIQASEGRPASGFKIFPGRRVEPMRA